MKKFFVLFCIPAAAIQDWMTTVDEATRKQQSDELMHTWQEWTTAHQEAIVDPGLPIGKTKRITAEGTADTKNDINWYLIVQAQSHEEAAELFTDHPHLQIPTSYIEVMDASRQPM